MYYQIYEWNHAFLSPARALNDAVRLYYRNPLNPLAHTEIGRQLAAAGDLFERVTRRYGKPEFGIQSVEIDGATVPVTERVVWSRPFCRLIHFERNRPVGAPKQPRVVIVAPMSGHYSTLLRGTVAALLKDNDVFITDWVDARMVPLAMGRFDLDTYIDYVIDWVDLFGGDIHMVAVCQPAVPVFAATALMEQREAAMLPRSITLMGGPIDTRQNPTGVNAYAARYELDWFKRNVIMTVPFPHPGVMRRVYPGFLQLTGFMTMNLDRHLSAHYDYFDDMVKGDGDSAEKHREFYDEYLSVMDLTEEFYLQTVDTVFLRQALPKGEMTHRGEAVDPAAITRTPIFTVEGEKDDISGIGQTRAAHTLTPNLPDERHQHYEQADVGHYGVFNGSRFRKEIAPRITEFVARWNDFADGATGTQASQPGKAATVDADTAPAEPAMAMTTAASTVGAEATETALADAAAAASAQPVRKGQSGVAGDKLSTNPLPAIGPPNPAATAAQKSGATLSRAEIVQDNLTAASSSAAATASAPKPKKKPAQPARHGAAGAKPAPTGIPGVKPQSKSGEDAA